MIEDEVFKKSTIVPSKCMQYGFKKEKDTYIYHKTILNNSFEIIIHIESNRIKGKIIDLETQEEYTGYRVEKQLGEFSSSIRSKYIELLEDIKEKCTIQNNFISKQANRISNWIKETYKDIPEYLWEDDKNAVFRNKQNKKWYGIIMYINKNKIDTEDKMIEVMNVKLPPEEIEELIKRNGYYRAYHMNKKHWITFVLDDTIKDKELKTLIDKSYQYTVKGEKND